MFLELSPYVIPLAAEKSHERTTQEDISNLINV